MNEWHDLEIICKALTEAGVPIKDAIEGKRKVNCKSQTQSVKES